MNNFRLIIIFLIILSVFAACNTKTLTEKEDSLNRFSTISSSETSEPITKNQNITHKNIEKVIISYLDMIEEVTEEERSFDFIDEIQSCNTIPKAILNMEVGDIRIKYIDNDSPKEFAKLYLGLDGHIYAKYYKDLDADFAYKFK